MIKKKSIQGQDAFDACLWITGTVEAIGQFVAENDLKIDDRLATGTDIQGEAVNENVLNFFSRGKIQISSLITDDQTQQLDAEFTIDFSLDFTS